jgi:aminomethyltransferase
LSIPTSATKGCYTGQEIVERVRSRGQVNRMRLLLKFDTAEPPSAGTALIADEKEVGSVTRTAFSPALRTSIGMAYVRREKATRVLNSSGAHQEQPRSSERRSPPATDHAQHSK